MDGVEATRTPRRKQPITRVGGTTGSDYEERALEVREAGAIDFVRKGRLDPDLVEIVVQRRITAHAAGESDQRAAERETG